jgi:hypothetical protein
MSVVLSLLLWGGINVQPFVFIAVPCDVSAPSPVSVCCVVFDLLITSLPVIWKCHVNLLNVSTLSRFIRSIRIFSCCQAFRDFDVAKKENMVLCFFTLH